MPLPLILAGLAVVAGGVGVKKGMDAKGDFDRANRIGERAKRNYQNAVEELEENKESTNDALVKLGKLKVKVFSNQIKHLVDVLSRTKTAKSKLQGFKGEIGVEELKQMERLVLGSLEIQNGIAKGAATGALAGLGAFGAVGALGTASTGTAIASLGGAAATNATLAWFGGGAIASGGLGMTVGAYAIGGIVLGPALAVGGFMLAKKAEEALTSAHEYEAKIEHAIAKMEQMGVVMEGIRSNVKELKNAIKETADRFDRIKVDDDSDPDALEKMIILGKGLKGLLDIPILAADGSAAPDIDVKISGYLEM